MGIKYLHLLILLMALSTGTLAYCIPYFAKIESISPKYDCLDINDRTPFCGGSIEVVNHCLGDFYFYSSTGELDEKFLMVNKEKWEQNYKYYEKLAEEGGVSIMGHTYRYEPSFVESWGYTDSLKDGEVVKEWEIKLYSVDNKQDIIVKGKTVYEEPSHIQENTSRIFRILAYIGFIGTFVLLLSKVIFKKRVAGAIAVLTFIFSLCSYFLSVLILNIVG